MPHKNRRMLTFIQLSALELRAYTMGEIGRGDILRGILRRGAKTEYERSLGCVPVQDAAAQNLERRPFLVLAFGHDR